MGGNATSAGVTFQSILCTKALATMLPLGLNLADLNLSARNERAVEVAAETSDFVDDLRIITPERTIYVQAKTTLSLSSSPSSELMKVVKQFVKQNRTATESDELVLCVSTDASRRVTSTLRKVLESIRTAGEVNSITWSKEKKQVERSLRALVERAYEDCFKIPCAEEEYLRLLKKMHVRVHVNSGEDAARQINLANKKRLSSAELWGRLHPLALGLANERNTFTRDQLRVFFHDIPFEVDNEPDKTAFRSLVPEVIPCGREFLLLDTASGLHLYALPRFDKKGRLLFKTSCGRALYKGEDLGEIILRGSSMESLNLGVGSPAALRKLAAGNLAVAVTDRLHSGEDLYPVAVARSNQLKHWMETKDDLYRCLKCGHPTSAGLNYLAEFDEGGCVEIGLVHPHCSLRNYRILGVWSDTRFSEQTLLSCQEVDNFSARLFKKDKLIGQYFKVDYPDKLPTVTIEWAPGNLGLPRGEYAVALVSETGKRVYYRDYSNKVVMTIRGDAETLRQNLIEHLSSNDEDFYALTESEAYDWSRSLRNQGLYEYERITEVSLVELSDVLRRKWNSFNYWAPLFVLTRNDNYVELNGKRVLYSNPFEIDAQVANLLGSNVSGLDLIPIEQDSDFDDRFCDWFLERHSVVVDPVVEGGELCEGYVITVPEDLDTSAFDQ